MGLGDAEFKLENTDLRFLWGHLMEVLTGEWWERCQDLQIQLCSHVVGPLKPQVQITPSGDRSLSRSMGRQQNDFERQEATRGMVQTQGGSSYEELWVRRQEKARRACGF